jgi:hypothetical protein
MQSITAGAVALLLPSMTQAVDAKIAQFCEGYARRTSRNGSALPQDRRYVNAQTKPVTSRMTTTAMKIKLSNRPCTFPSHYDPTTESS